MTRTIEQRDMARSIFDIGHTLEHFITTDRVASEDARRSQLLLLCEQALGRVEFLRSQILAGEEPRPTGGLATPTRALGASSPAEALCTCSQPQSVCDAAVRARLGSPGARTPLKTGTVVL